MVATPANDNAPVIANMSSFWLVIPWAKIATGQPASGLLIGKPNAVAIATSGRVT